jgi:hypothetical protein
MATHYILDFELGASEFYITTFKRKFAPSTESVFLFGQDTP